MKVDAWYARGLILSTFVSRDTGVVYHVSQLGLDDIQSSISIGSFLSSFSGLSWTGLEVARVEKSGKISVCISARHISDNRKGTPGALAQDHVPTGPARATGSILARCAVGVEFI